MSLASQVLGRLRPWVLAGILLHTLACNAAGNAGTASEDPWLVPWQKVRSILPDGAHPELIEAARAGARIHFVGIYAPRTQTYDEYGVGIIDLAVTDVTAPLIVIASNREAVHWRVRLAPRVRLLAFVAVGYRRTRVSGVGTNTELLSYAEEDGAAAVFFARPRDAAEINHVYDAVTTSFGHPPTTVQSGEAPAFTLDGVNTTRVPSLPLLGYREPPFLYFAQPERGAVGSVDSARELICCPSPAFAAMASRSHIRGAWYFEAHLHIVNGGPNADQATSVGVIPPSEFTLIDETQGRADAHWLNPAMLRNGDTIAIALDCERGRLHVAKNGRWIGSDPNRGAGGRELRRGRDYVAAFTTQHHGGKAGDQTWDVNLGQRQFRYAAPTGFSPYGLW